LSCLQQAHACALAATGLPFKCAGSLIPINPALASPAILASSRASDRDDSSNQLETGMDVRIDFQRFRRSTAAHAVRRAMFQLLVGREGWPMTFRAPSTPLPLVGKSSPNIYIHLPFCSSICPHCPYNKVLLRPKLYQPYRDALIRELTSHYDAPHRVPIRTLYFGGGTPSLHPELIGEIVVLLRNLLAEDAEIGVEVHPLHATPESLARLRAAGVNRISLGIESLDDGTLRFLERGYTATQARRSVQAATAAGFECVDVNLIFGTPGQQWDDAVVDAIECARMGVDQISAYPLFTFPHTRLGAQVQRGKAPIAGELSRLRAQKGIAQACLSEGLQRTSVWSYTRPGVSPYSTVTRDSYIGFGAGAGSKVDATFWFNTFSVREYSKLEGPKPALVMELPDRLSRFHWVYWQIYRTSLDTDEYQRKFGRDFARDFAVLTGCMRLFGWCHSSHGRLQVSERGAIWAHRLQCLFSLSYIDKVWDKCRRVPWPEEIVLG
jgi:oxygen-independent coproporphyrinogen-3 oxidase